MLYAHGAIMGLGGGFLHLWLFGVSLDDRRPRADRDVAPPHSRWTPCPAWPGSPRRPGGTPPSGACVRRRAPAAAWPARWPTRRGGRTGPRRDRGGDGARRAGPQSVSAGVPLGRALLTRGRVARRPGRVARAGQRHGRRTRRACASAGPSCWSAPATCGTTTSRHPAYERILDELAPDEARVLLLLLEGGPQPSVDVRTGGPVGMVNSQLIAPGLTMIGARAGCRYLDQVPSYLNNLFRLGLVWFSRESLARPAGVPGRRGAAGRARRDALGAVRQGGAAQHPPDAVRRGLLPHLPGRRGRRRRRAVPRRTPSRRSPSEGSTG